MSKEPMAFIYIPTPPETDTMINVANIEAIASRSKGCVPFMLGEIEIKSQVQLVSGNYLNTTLTVFEILDLIKKVLSQ